MNVRNFWLFLNIARNEGYLFQGKKEKEFTR